MRNSQQEIANPSNANKAKNELAKNQIENKIENKKNSQFMATKKLTYIATLVAITLLFKVLGNLVPIGDSFKISFIYFGWIISGAVLGPLGGGAVGLITDILGTIIAPMGSSINLAITLGNTLFPFLVGLCYKYIPLKHKFFSLLIGSLAGLIVCTMGINSLGLYFWFGYNKSISFPLYLFTLRVFQPIIVGINFAIAAIFMPIIIRLKIFNR